MKLIEKYVNEGIISGAPADLLLANGGDPCVLRPFIGADGRSYVTHRRPDGTYEAVLTNANATLRKDEWKLLDDAVIKAAKERLRLVDDLRGAGLTFNIPQGMGKTVLETEAQSDINAAVISMDGLREAPGDRPEYSLTNLPLPITHKDFQFSARQILASRNGGSPLDTTMAELAARKVAEQIEKLCIGVLDSYTFGGGTVYGLVNYPHRLTQTLTDPTDSNWTGATLLSEVIAMRTASINAKHYGPWVLYVAPAWDAYLDEDYKDYSDVTVRDRIKAVNGINDIRTLDFLEDYDMVLVQQSSDVIRLVIGKDITTLQWDTKGGMQKNFKVMAIMVPQVRCDFNSNTGIVHGSV